jgi:selenophosphate synthase
VSGGSRRNAGYAAGFTDVDADVAPWRRWLAYDATTSGGRLIAVAPERADALPGAVIVAGEPGRIALI